MEHFLYFSFANTVMAGLLAVLATLAGRVVRRPAVSHAFWLLVLLKLITPPLVHVPVGWQSDAGLSSAVDDFAEPGPVMPIGEEGFAWAPAEGPAPLDEAVPTNGASVPALPGWSMSLGGLWVAGSVAWVALALTRLLRFRRLLRHAEPASFSLQDEANTLADRLGLTVSPGVWLVPGRVSPMLWWLGGAPKLLLPAELLDRLEPKARATLLIHELAHLRRGDHLVRLLEFVVTAVYWWNPVVWWARRELREAEEQCCDAWVVWALPGAKKAYALALVETVDFLSEARPLLPAAASGVGHVQDLRKRVTMIMRGTTPRSLTWLGGLAVLAVGLLLLPALPGWADERDEKEPGKKKEKIEKEIIIKRDGDNREADLDRARADLKKMEADLEQMRAKLREAEDRLQQARRRVEELTRAGEPREPRREEPPRGSGGPPRDPGPVKPGPRDPGPGGPGREGGDRRIQELERKLDDVIRELENLRREMRRGPGGPPPGPGDRGPGAPPGGDRRPGSGGPPPGDRGPDPNRPVPERPRDR